LALALKKLPKVYDPRVLVGHNTADDAGILKIDDTLALVTTVDLMAPVVDDPYDFGFIAATNCLSDIYAMGGDPLVCLNVVGWPTSISAEILGDIMKGSQDAVLQSGAVTLGGHTFQSSEIRYGLAVTGRIHPEKIYTNAAARAGDNLILTKPIGTGTVINCVISRGAAPEETFNSALQSMKTSNASAAKAMRDIGGAHSCTDITGFGFLGHCWEMAAGSNMGIEISAGALPVFPHVCELIKEGIIDGSHKMNMNSFKKGIRFEGADVLYETLLYSSETSGGLLISVAPESTDKMLAGMHKIGLCNARVIGSVVAEHTGVLCVKP